MTLFVGTDENDPGMFEALSYPPGFPLAEAVSTAVDWWGERPAPAWVASDDAELASTVAARFGVEVAAAPEIQVV